MAKKRSKTNRSSPKSSPKRPPVRARAPVKKTLEKEEKKPLVYRLLTAEGWRRLMLKKKK